MSEKAKAAYHPMTEAEVANAVQARHEQIIADRAREWTEHMSVTLGHTYPTGEEPTEETP